MLHDLLKVCVGAETKPNEARRALSPGAVKELLYYGVYVSVQTYPNGAYGDDAYRKMGANIVETTRLCDVIFATKEWSPLCDNPKEMFNSQTLVGFHHVHKGQPHNIPMLRTAILSRASLFDYELFRLKDGTQPITTSRYAGIAGAANGLWALGQRLPESALKKLPKPAQFHTVNSLQEQITAVRTSSVRDLKIVVVGKTGVCGKGALEVCSWLGISQISATDLLKSPEGPWFCALGTEDIVERTEGGDFNRDEYRKLGRKKYHSTFGRFLGKFNLLIFCPYWDNRYPKILPRELMIERQDDLPLVISDVTCDIAGSTECTLSENHVNTPVSTYFPRTNELIDGFQDGGLTVTAVDNLPAQLAISCSEFVSAKLMKYAVWPLIRMKRDAEFHSDCLPENFWPAFVTYQGAINPRYKHLEALL